MGNFQQALFFHCYDGLLLTELNATYCKLWEMCLSLCMDFSSLILSAVQLSNSDRKESVPPGVVSVVEHPNTHYKKVFTIESQICVLLHK